MAKKKQQLKKIAFTKEIICVHCKYRPTPEELGKACSRCGGRYDVVDKVQERQPFIKDPRQHGAI